MPYLLIFDAQRGVPTSTTWWSWSAQSHQRPCRSHAASEPPQLLQLPVLTLLWSHYKGRIWLEWEVWKHHLGRSCGLCQRSHSPWWQMQEMNRRGAHGNTGRECWGHKAPHQVSEDPQVPCQSVNPWQVNHVHLNCTWVARYWFIGCKGHQFCSTHRPTMQYHYNGKVDLCLLHLNRCMVYTHCHTRENLLPQPHNVG